MNPGSHTPQACILNHARRRPHTFVVAFWGLWFLNYDYELKSYGWSPLRFHACKGLPLRVCPLNKGGGGTSEVGRSSILIFQVRVEPAIAAFNSRPKNGLIKNIDLVQSPQPACNPNQTQNQKSNPQQKVLEVEVAGLCFLLLLI